MAYDYGGMRRVAVDPRIVVEIGRSPKMTAEQGVGFMSGWGGPSQYQVLARLPMEERLVYASVLEGASSSFEMEEMTGLTGREVEEGLAGLQKRGLVDIGEIVK